MKDDVVIAHQARKIAELEIKVARALESERQLLAILRSAGIEVTEMELNQDEAEFLRRYRNATPEGKATIQRKAEEMAENTGMSISGKEDLTHVGPSRDLGRQKTRKSNPAKGAQVEELSGLPNDFFKRTGD